MINLFESMQNIHSSNPPLRTVGCLIRLHIEDLVTKPEGEIGLRRAMHVAAMLERSYAVHSRFDGSFLRRELHDEIYVRLQTAHLQPEESRFRDICAWNADRECIRKEMRSNLERLLSDRMTECLAIGIDLHVLWQTYALNHFGDADYVPVFVFDDLRHHELRNRVAYIETLFDGKLRALRLNVAA